MASPEPQPLRSVYTAGFPELLDELGISLVVTTYQAGKLVVLRADGASLNTHFRTLHSPMGLAADAQRLTVGVPNQILEFHNVPAAAPKIEPVGRHDACYLPRSTHVTGDIQVHELARAGDELWCVNTRFSCLCTFDAVHNFVPRWRPRFISALRPEDRCHLNGLALVDGRPGFVTAHGSSDTPGGWRQDKARGGVVIDVRSNEIIASGLAMPHSPRWHEGRLWVLESGAGTVGVIDARTGRYESIAELSGFTRGLDFHGRYAFIGLSQVRESATFSGIPITERNSERTCGVWVLDTHTGRTLAFVKFEDAVQEIFAVQALPGIRYPEVINDWNAVVADSFVLPGETLHAVRAPSREPLAAREAEPTPAL